MSIICLVVYFPHERRTKMYKTHSTTLQTTRYIKTTVHLESSTTSCDDIPDSAHVRVTHREHSTHHTGHRYSARGAIGAIQTSSDHTGQHGYCELAINILLDSNIITSNV